MIKIRRQILNNIPTEFNITLMLGGAWRNSEVAPKYFIKVIPYIPQQK